MIDWEQCRYEIAKSIFASVHSNHEIYNAIINLAEKQNALDEFVKYSVRMTYLTGSKRRMEKERRNRMIDLFGEHRDEKKKPMGKVFKPLCASNHTSEQRQQEDYYATHPIAAEHLINLEPQLSNDIWEICAGGGHLADVFSNHGYSVRKSDIIMRRTDIEQLDFLQYDDKIDCDVVTNPPYSIATKMIYHAMNLLTEGHYLCMWLRILFLESAERRVLFSEYPPQGYGLAQREYRVLRMEILRKTCNPHKAMHGSFFKKDIQAILN